jgi:hypothetical protein
MREFELYLKVDGWKSDYKSVQRLLDSLNRKTSSELSRGHYLEAWFEEKASASYSRPLPLSTGRGSHSL